MNLQNLIITEYCSNMEIVAEDPITREIHDIKRSKIPLLKYFFYKPNYVTQTDKTRKNRKKKDIPIYIMNMPLTINGYDKNNIEVRFTQDGTNYWYVYTYVKRSLLSQQKLLMMRENDKQRYKVNSRIEFNCLLCYRIIKLPNMWSHKQTKIHNKKLIEYKKTLLLYFPTVISDIIHSYREGHFLSVQKNTEPKTITTFNFLK